MSRGERGQALIEFAVILPLLILTMLSVVEIGWYFIARLSISNAAMAGAEFAAHEGITDPIEVEERVRDAAGGIQLDEGDITVMIAASQTPHGLAPKYALVEITYTYKPLVTGNLFRRRVTIKASAIKYYPLSPRVEYATSPGVL